MARKAPWHSVKAFVYHNNSSCNTGNNIERENAAKVLVANDYVRNVRDLVSFLLE